MRILHVVALVHASTGGPAFSVTRLASEQAALGHEVALATLDYPQLGPLVPAPGVRIRRAAGGRVAVHGRGWSPSLAAIIREEAAQADIVHNHGLWMWPNAYARRAAVSERKPLVISPRGMLDAWSLRRSRLKKGIAWWMFERRNLRSAALFHATALSEEASIRALRLRQPVVVAPNGVDCPDLATRPPRAVLEEQFPALRGKRWVAFLSRLHPKKGLDLLLPAWGRVATDEDATLVVAGPDLTGYRGEVDRMAAEPGCAGRVVVTGELQGPAKAALLGNAEFLVLPSYSENFGMVVAETMAWARPVIVSTAAPWSCVTRSGAGWWLEPEPCAVESALREALGAPPGRLDAMGQAGRRLVESEFTWKKSTETLLGAYDEARAAGV